MLDYVNSIQPEHDVPLAEGVKNFCLRNSGKGIVVLISDLMDKQGFESAFRYLIAQEMDTYVVQVLSPEEVEPDVTGDVKLIDCEDKDATEITVSRPLLDRYQRTLAAFVESAREYCVRRGMGYVLANTDVPIQQLVAVHLRQWGLVR